MNEEYIRGEFETFVKLGNEKKIFTSGKDIAIESDFSNIQSKRNNRNRKNEKKVEQGYKKRDDLTYRQLARFKAINGKDSALYQELNSNRVDLAFIKGVGLEDSSLEEVERLIEQNRIQEASNSDSSNDGRRSDNSELKLSVRSSQNFWMNLENKKKDRKMVQSHREKREKEK